MKNLFTVLLIFFSISCAKNHDSINQTKNDLPIWIMEAQTSMTSIGIASPSKGGIKMQLAMAEINAKGNLAAGMYSEISRVTKEALRSANVNQNDDVEAFFAQATKEVVNDLPLSGITRDKFFWSKDGTLYIHIILNPDIYDKYLASAEKSFESRLKKSQLGRDNINKSEIATKAIFDELERERNVIK